MSPRLPGAPCVLVAAMMLALGVPEASAFPGFGRRAYETVYVPSSASILLEPTAYYVPTSYVDYAPTIYTSTSYVPSSYVLSPTRYLVSPTTYLRPSTYYSPTRYVVQRPLVTTSSSLVERAYYVPTVTTLDLPLLSTSSSSSLCCDGSISSGTSGRIVSDDPVYELPPEAADAGTNVPAPANTSSGSTNPSAGEPPLDPGVLRSEPRQPSTTRQTDSPPAAAQPVRPLDDEDLPLVDPNLDINPPPAPPADEVPPGPGVSDAGSQRSALRPAFSRPLAEARSGLLGKVVSAVSGQPESGVLVTLTDRSGRFVARTATTGADGSFSIILPEGDWAVTVPKPGDSGGAQSEIDRYITVSGGLITDDQNREVTLMTINR